MLCQQYSQSSHGRAIQDVACFRAAQPSHMVPAPIPAIYQNFRYQRNHGLCPNDELYSTSLLVEQRRRLHVTSNPHPSPMKHEQDRPYLTPSPPNSPGVCWVGKHEIEEFSCLAGYAPYALTPTQSPESATFSHDIQHRQVVSTLQIPEMTVPSNEIQEANDDLDFSSSDPFLAIDSDDDMEFLKCEPAEGATPPKELVVKSRLIDQPYATLIYEALTAAPNQSMALQDIYTWFIDNTDKVKEGCTGWKNSIRHNLSMNDDFLKVPISLGSEDAKKQSIWILSEKAIREGCVEPTTRYRKEKDTKTTRISPRKRYAGRPPKRVGAARSYTKHIKPEALHPGMSSTYYPQPSMCLPTMLETSYPSTSYITSHECPATPIFDEFTYDASLFPFDFNTNTNTNSHKAAQAIPQHYSTQYGLDDFGNEGIWMIDEPMISPSWCHAQGYGV